VEGRASIYQQAAQGFQQGFANVDAVEQIYLGRDGHLLEEELDTLRRSPPRLVVAIGTQAARYARERLPGFPVLYCLALHPLQNKLVGTNIGGVALDVELSQQLDSIQRVLPQVRRIGVVYDELTSGPLVRQAQQYVKASVQLIALEARTPREAAQTIPQLLDTVDAFWLLWDPVIANPANFKLLVELSLKYKVALIAPARPFVEAGALMSIGADYVKAGEQIGRMAQQVLKSEARPEDFVAVPPPNLVVTINGEVARRLGMKISPKERVEILGTP
jgi:putative ABC transport system substrate-binding protein